MEERKIMERWAEYFNELLNKTRHDGSDTGKDKNYTERDGEINPPTVEEVKESVSRQKNARSPGEDGITAELIKHGDPGLVKVLHRLICKIWESEKLPEDWKTGLICPIHKKGDKLNAKTIEVLRY